METGDRHRLEKMYHDLSDEALADMLAQPPESYQAGVYPLLQSEAEKRGLPSREQQSSPPGKADLPCPCAGGADQPVHEPRFVRFMSVENKDDQAFVENVFKAAQIPYVLAEEPGNPQALAVMVEEGWLAQAGELFKEQ